MEAPERKSGKRRYGPVLNEYSKSVKVSMWKCFWIAGDLFHRQPLRRELKELDYLFSKLTMTEVVIIAGNHDYLKRDSYYRTFQWSKNVHMILDREIQCVEFPAYSLAIYGMSYDTKQITEECYCDAFAQRRQPLTFYLK